MCMYNSKTIVMDSSVSKRKAEISFFFQNDLAFIWILGNSNTYIGIYPFSASVNTMT